MLSSMVVALMCLLFCGLAQSSNTTNVDSKVVNGNTVTAMIPYQVRLSVEYGGDTSICGGALIDLSWVVSAAHCVVSKGATANHVVTVYAGSTDAQGTGATARTVDGIYLPQEWQNDPASYTDGADIAMLHLSTPYTTVAGSIEVIPLGTTNPAAGSQVRVSGWGSQNDASGPFPDTLQEGLATVLSQAQVDEQFRAQSASSPDTLFCNFLGDVANVYNFNKIIATGGTTAPIVDTCQGDSGGPVVVADQSSAVGYNLVAVVSHGQACGQPGKPGFSASTVGNLAWIQSIMANRPTLCGTERISCGPNAECVNGACACRTGYSTWNGQAVDLYGYFCGLFLYGGVAQTSGSVQYLYQVVPVNAAWTQAIVHGYSVGGIGESESENDFGCGYLFYPESESQISSVMASLSSLASTASLGTAPTGIWTAYGEDGSNGWKRYPNINTPLDLVSTLPWGAGEPAGGTCSQALSSTSLLDAVACTSSTWRIVQYHLGQVTPSPSPLASPSSSPGPSPSPSPLYQPPANTASVSAASGAALAWLSALLLALLW